MSRTRKPGCTVTLHQPLALGDYRSPGRDRPGNRLASHEVAVDDLAVTFADAVTNTIAEGLGDPRVLEDAIGALPPGQRQAIELLKLSEMSLKEATTASGVTSGALKVATHRVMAALRRTLAGG